MTSNPFVLTSTDFGPMIVNRLDYQRYEGDIGYLGVGCDLLQHGKYRQEEIDRCFDHIFHACNWGRPVVVLDVGANIGTHTVQWAKKMAGWGEVIAIEPQESVYYALCGNIALNNCFNARAILGAAAATSGDMLIPWLDPAQPANFGGLSLQKDGTHPISSIAIDDFQLPRLDFMKIDVEGMELEVLKGACETIGRCRPTIVIENNHGGDKYTEICTDYRWSDFDDLNILLKPEAK
jgi:FkbM family methyltransferase